MKSTVFLTPLLAGGVLVFGLGLACSAGTAALASQAQNSVPPAATKLSPSAVPAVNAQTALFVKARLAQTRVAKFYKDIERAFPENADELLSDLQSCDYGETEGPTIVPAGEISEQGRIYVNLQDDSETVSGLGAQLSQALQVTQRGEFVAASDIANMIESANNSVSVETPSKLLALLKNCKKKAGQAKVDTERMRKMPPKELETKSGGQITQERLAAQLRVIEKELSELTAMEQALSKVLTPENKKNVNAQLKEMVKALEKAATLGI